MEMEKMDMNEVQLPENVVALHETEGSGLDGRGHGSTQDLSVPITL